MVKMEMKDETKGSDWYSLSGFLDYRPGGGLGRLFFRRRLWFVLDADRRQLVGYRSAISESLHSSSSRPSVCIDLQSAGIFSNPDEHNQFSIVFSKDEHSFTADNHESCMIWMLALQALRNRCSELTAQEQALTMTSSTVLMTSFNSRGLSQVGLVNEQLDMEQNSLERAAGVSKFNRQNSVVSQRTYGYQKYQRPLRRSYRNKGVSLDSGLAFYQKQDGSLEELCFGSEPGGDVFTDLPNCEEDVSETVMGMQQAFSDDLLLGSDTSSVCNCSSLCNESMPGSPSRPKSDNFCSSDSALDSSCNHHHHSSLARHVVDLEQQLLRSKCELAKLINSETTLKGIITRRDSVIRDMEEKVERLERDQNAKKSRTDNQIRELENRVQFLGREIKQLVQLRHNDQRYIQQQRTEIDELKAEIETWKDDYVYLLQSCITLPTGDLVDGWQMKLFGGDTHRYRVQQLVAEVRQINPTLPEFTWLIGDKCHVDQFGFRHQLGSDENLVLHYLCQQLHLHYSSLRSSYQRTVERWTYLLSCDISSTNCPLTNKKEMKYLCRRGIPMSYRSEIWRRLVHAQVCDVKAEKGEHYYRHLVMRSHESPVANCYRKQIGLDLMRTMPTNVNFNSLNAEGIRRLREVLEAFSMHNPDIGYCQGLNFITAVFLLFLNTEDSFWGLVAITEKYFLPNYFDKELTGARADQEVLKELIHIKLQDISNHLNSIDIELSTISLNWFLAIFFESVPFQTLLRIWDCFLVEGPKVLFRFSMAILKQHQELLINQPDTITTMRFLKSCTKTCFDADGLMQLSFECLKPFPRRSDIQQRQSKQLLALKSRHRKYNYDVEVPMADGSSNRTLHYECALISPDGIVWLFSGSQSDGQISRFNCSDGLAKPVDFKFESQVLCACTVNSLLIVATLARQLYAIDHTSCQQVWSIGLNDVAICFLNTSNVKGFLFAGLANGSILILEDIESGRAPTGDGLFYRSVGQAPVMSMLPIGTVIWIACGNIISLINTTSLNTVERLSPLTISTSSVEECCIQSMVADGRAELVWVALRGCCVLELWDAAKRTCIALYDCRTGHCLGRKMESDLATTSLRVTSLLSAYSCLWVGSADGTLYIYDIEGENNSATCTDDTTSEMAEKSISACLLRKYTSRRGSCHISASDLTVFRKDSIDAGRRLGASLKMLNGEMHGRTPDSELDTVEDLKFRRRHSRLVASNTFKDERRRSHCGISLSLKNQNESKDLQSAELANIKKRFVTRSQESVVHMSTQCKEHVRRCSSAVITDNPRRSRTLTGHDNSASSIQTTLQLEAKIKVSERPVRYLLNARSSDSEPIIISLSGCYGDDEAVLMWKRGKCDSRWLNEPVWEVCPETQYPRRQSSYKLYQKRSQSVRSDDSPNVF